jgi:glycosyltransferase involved in cell wall biosynthesis
MHAVSENQIVCLGQEDCMKSPSSVVFLVPGFPKDENDTECIPALQNYIFYFTKLNPAIQVTVIAFQYPYFRGDYKWNNIPVYSAGGKNRRRLFRIVTWLRVVCAFLRLARKSNIKIIHSFWLDECTFVAQYLAKALKIKQVASIGGQDAKSTNAYLRRLDFSKLTVTAGSNFSAEIFQNAVHRKVEQIIPIGLDHQRFGTVDSTQSRAIDILGVGSLIPIKNFGLFVEIISTLIVEFPELNAKIIGAGSQYQYLKQLTREKLQNNIQLLGELPRRQVFDYMTQSKILLHTSSYEGQGYVFMEALYCGMTVVSFDVGYLGQTPKAIKCANKKIMIENLRKLLKRRLDYNQVLIKPIEETADEFKRLYKI